MMSGPTMGSPAGFAPVIPGVTSTATPPPNGMSPDTLIAMMMGMRPQGGNASPDKMAQVVQLLREISKQDPRLGMIAGEALRVLIDGPQPGPGGPSPMMSGGPAGAPLGMPGQAPGLPIGGPGGMLP